MTESVMLGPWSSDSCLRRIINAGYIGGTVLALPAAYLCTQNVSKLILSLCGASLVGASCCFATSIALSLVASRIPGTMLMYVKGESLYSQDAILKLTYTLTVSNEQKERGQRIVKASRSVEVARGGRPFHQWIRASVEAVADLFAWESSQE